jgi:hypothetical protein
MTQSAYMTRWRIRRAREGICLGCLEPASTGRLFCAYHRQLQILRSSTRDPEMLADDFLNDPIDRIELELSLGIQPATDGRQL